MGFNNFTSSGSITAYNMYSDGTPSGNNGTNVADSTAGVPYTVTQLRTAVGNLFEVAIDVNTTSAMGETLQSFQVIENATPSTCGANGCTTGTVLYDFTGPHLIGNIANNGNGFGDWSLGTINLASLMGSDTILFHAVWNNASDGAESFFLVPVPGPVVGAGLPGLVMACGGLITLARRRRKLVV
jgi:hypothetical protein